MPASAHAENTDTIVAVATPPGRGAVGILRLSGPRARAIGAAIAGDITDEARRARLRDFRDAEGTVLDRGLLLYFPAPHSYTGEDVVELQGHGGPVLLSLLLQAACAHGARPARAGEFSERAFLNGRLDLAQAEAVADLIEAGSAAAARAASRSLHGEFSQRVNALVETLVALRADLEASLDFADEEVPWLSAQTLRQRLAELLAQLEAVQAAAAQGRRLREGLTVAIVGQPNVGKSTLLNRLAGVEAAIVSPQAGTTRDLLREQVVIGGLPLNVVDTAGLRDTADPVEREGVRRAWAALAQAEVVLYLIDDQHGISNADEALLARIGSGPQIVLVRNKCDLSQRAPQREELGGGLVSLRLSAASGRGLELLEAELKRAAGLAVVDAGVFSARQRHLESLRQARAHVQAAEPGGRTWTAELTAEELRLAQQALESITGRFTPDDLLGRIFSSFCIGK
jgi:tRNA modification GTPase